MNLVEMKTKIRKEEIEPKVYAVVLSKQVEFGKQANALWIGASFTLDEAVTLAKREVAEKKGNPMEYTMAMFREISLEKAINSLTEIEFITVHNSCEKNDLMNKIIATKDKDLYEENIGTFTNEERKFLMSKLGL